ncbi:type VII secretion protein EccB [Cryptosporangium aurantiacum]|uniref:Type VII secretion protein EccB n=1 Tax=Cryptosporangium aurantiacum TaxID=134849 RepID=A0A1M7TXH0_9ACTN|nr:type VII secretion protein EccB [Cryptosporangium aurantiacum]SHN75444.1 type VII secretion protein EccB [Cryptosporangium aurantiacum]
MASRKDQLHSYQFMLQRAISALIMRETDPAQSPLRRGVGAAFVGVMVTVIVAAAFGIYGLLTKTGSGRWKVENAVVVEKETGAAFVYAGETLIPALNYSSALLLAGQAPPKTFTVPRNSLRGVPRGTPHGIADAPAALPSTKLVLDGGWSSCVLPSRDAAGGDTVVTMVIVGGGPADAVALGESGLYVRDAAAGAEYLVWRGHRYRLTGSTVPSALFGSGTRPVEAGSAWLDTLPEGDPIRELSIPDAGQESEAVPGHDIGEVVADRRDNGETDYLVLDDGLAPLTGLQMDLLRATRAVEPVTMATAEITAARKSEKLESDSPADQRAPERSPKLAATSAKSGLCAAFVGENAPLVTVVPEGGSTDVGTPTRARTNDGAVLADRIVVPGGAIAVVRARETGTYSLVTDVGVRFPVESAEALAMLGYSTGDAVTLPTALLDRVPAGPALTQEGAARTASPGER